MMYELLDKLPPWALVVLIAAVLTLASHLGRRLGKRRPVDDATADNPHTGAIVGALLALLGLLLAFSFSAVESRFATRKQLVLDDANAIGTTFLRAGLLDPEQRDAVRSGLRDYVDLRLHALTPERIAAGLKRSDEIHRKLWRQAEESAERHPRSVMVGLFVSSLNEMIDLHEKRITVGLTQRLPLTTLGVLGAVATLSLGLVGYIGGVARTRSRFPSVAIIIAVSFVTMLIMDLDRPRGTLFKVGQQAMVDVGATIDAFGTPARPPP